MVEGLHGSLPVRPIEPKEDAADLIGCKHGFLFYAVAEDLEVRREVLALEGPVVGSRVHQGDGRLEPRLVARIPKRVDERGDGGAGVDAVRRRVAEHPRGTSTRVPVRIVPERVDERRLFVTDTEVENARRAVGYNRAFVALALLAYYAELYRVAEDAAERSRYLAKAETYHATTMSKYTESHGEVSEPARRIWESIQRCRDDG